MEIIKKVIKTLVGLLVMVFMSVVFVIDFICSGFSLSKKDNKVSLYIEYTILPKVIKKCEQLLKW